MATTTCRSCGAVVTAGSHFCHSCGTPFGPPRTGVAESFTSPLTYTPRHLAERILSTRSAIEGENKQVTVMFCDIADSTRLAEQIGPEEMFQLLNRFFAMAMEEVHRYEGTINQFLGDGFMALFGAPLALEHHERQSVLAALGLRGRVKDLSTPSAGTIRIRVGLNTGRVVVGKIGDNLRMDYTAVGDTTNVAARLQQAADPGTILASAATLTRLQDVCESDPMGVLQLKGKTDGVAAYRVNDLRRSRSAQAGLGDRRLHAFVAREMELSALYEALAEAEQSRGCAVGVVGEPGIGKSRLLLEFRRSVAGRRLTYLEGRCLPYGRSIPYLPVIDILHANCRIVDTDTPETMSEKARGALVEVGLDPTDRLPYVLNLLGVKESGGPLENLSPETVRERTFDTLRALCVRGSRLRPLVIVVEDLHWTDQTSEEFLASAAERLGGSSILLITTYRPGYLPPWMGRSYMTQLALRPLPDADATRLLRSVLPDHVTAKEVGTLLSRGEGNPLFLEELAQAMTQSGSTTSAHADVPGTLQDVLAARIDRLSDATKHLLQIASVVGREFAPDLIARIWDGDADPEALLRDLVRLELVYQRTWPDSPLYVFKHALTRDAAYASLLDVRRRKYHAAVGHALHETYAGRTTEVVDLLAYHFERSDDDEAAIDFAIAAAEKAQRRWANQEALALTDRALSRLGGMSDSHRNRLRRVDAVLRQAEVRFALGQQGQQLEALSSLRSVIDGDADEPRKAAWHYWIGFLTSMTGGDLTTALRHCETASEIAARAGLELLQAQADSGLCQVCVITGELRRAVEVGTRALTVFEGRGNVWWACRTLAHLSPAANALGEWRLGIAYCERALAHALAADDARLRISTHIRLAATHVQRGDCARGLGHLDIAEQFGPAPFDLAALRAIRGYALVKSGGAEAGTALIGEAVAWYEQTRLSFTGVLFSLWLAEGQLHSQQVAPAVLTARRARDLSARGGYRYLEGVAHRILAEGLPVGDASAIAAHLDQAEALLASVDARNELAKAWRVRADRVADAQEATILRARADAVFRDLETIM